MNTSKCWLDKEAGVWYASVTCNEHGIVDETVSWDEAKTAHTACQIARARHFGHMAPDEKTQEQMEAEFAQRQIDAAAEQLTHYAILLAQAKKAAQEARGSARESEALRSVEARERDVKNATQRYHDTKATNAHRA